MLNAYSLCKLFFDLRTNIALSKSKYCFDFWLMDTNILQHNDNKNVSLKFAIINTSDSELLI